MGLVDYSDSEVDEDETKGNETAPPAKRRRVSGATSNLPPLPQAFRDLYSSTVRTSTQDDPSLHGGRKRVIPHVPGNWPTHVYLEWSPSPRESDVLAQLIGAQDKPGQQGKSAKDDVRSLLQNDLGVALPLHISLSRPLVLRTEQKDDFFFSLKDAISSSGGARASETSFEQLQWHPNEDRTRWFLVLRVTDDDDALFKLLRTCNSVAVKYGQPKLYEDDDVDGRGKRPPSQMSKISEKFHISIAWSLEEPPSSLGMIAGETACNAMDLPPAVRSLRVPFGEVKVRIGQDVTSMPLDPRRRRTSGVLS